VLQPADCRPWRVLSEGVCQIARTWLLYHVYSAGAGQCGPVCRWRAGVPSLGSGGHNVAEINEIEQKVIDIVAEQMGVDKAEITRDTSFINDLNADSLDTVELVMEFEDEFEMSIPDEEAEKIQTVGQAIDYIKSVADKQGPKE
jgi:acyl carrier protein